MFVVDKRCTFQGVSLKRGSKANTEALMGYSTGHAADNEYVDGWVVVTVAGDIDGDFNVDYRDLFILARNYAKEK